MKKVKSFAFFMTLTLGLINPNLSKIYPFLPKDIYYNSNLTDELTRGFIFEKELEIFKKLYNSNKIVGRLDEKNGFVDFYRLIVNVGGLNYETYVFDCKDNPILESMENIKVEDELEIICMMKSKGPNREGNYSCITNSCLVEKVKNR